jgi:hypothetical protein
MNDSNFLWVPANRFFFNFLSFTASESLQETTYKTFNRLYLDFSEVLLEL